MITICVQLNSSLHVSNSKIRSNMDTFSALIFVGIISLSNCRPEIQSQIQSLEKQQTNPDAVLKCPDLPSKQQFNATAYFHDVWYVIHSFNPDTPSNNSEEKLCFIITSQILENGNVKQLYTKLLGEPELPVETLVNLDDYKNGVGKFISRLIDKEGNPIATTDTLLTTIIETDYSNYAVEHKCISLCDGILGTYLILNRKPNTLDPKIKAVFEKFGLKMQDILSMGKPGCEEIDV